MEGKGEREGKEGVKKRKGEGGRKRMGGESVDVDVVDLRAQADASMPASNNNVNYTIYSNF